MITSTHFILLSDSSVSIQSFKKQPTLSLKGPDPSEHMHVLNMDTSSMFIELLVSPFTPPAFCFKDPDSVMEPSPCCVWGVMLCRIFFITAACHQMLFNCFGFILFFILLFFFARALWLLVFTPSPQQHTIHVVVSCFFFFHNLGSFVFTVVLFSFFFLV